MNYDQFSTLSFKFINLVGLFLIFEITPNVFQNPCLTSKKVFQRKIKATCPFLSWNHLFRPLAFGKFMGQFSSEVPP